MTEVKEFFQAGGILEKGHPSYIKRACDTELLKAIEKNEFCIISAPRQMGKSSLMISTASELKEKGISTVIVDLQHFKDSEQSEAFYVSIIFDICKKLDLGIDVIQWWKNHSPLADTYRFELFFEIIILKKVNGNIVVFFDEIDSVLSLSFSDSFFTTIRKMYNARASKPIFKKLCIVLLGLSSPSYFIKKPSVTPFNIGKLIILEDFTFDSIIPFEKALGKGSRKIVERIYEWTDGQPFLLQELAKSIYLLPSKERGVPRVEDEVIKLYLNPEIDKSTHFRAIQNFLLSGTDSRTVFSILQIYTGVWLGDDIHFDKNSLPHSRLLLSGIVKIKKSCLVPRNPLYKTKFNMEWAYERIKKLGFIFISHSTKEDNIVSVLRDTLEARGFIVWIDSRQLKSVDKLESDIKKTIEHARAFIVILSINAFNTPWILKEVNYAVQVKNKRQDDFIIIPLLMEGVEPRALNMYFKEEPVGIMINNGPGGINEAIPQILAALGERQPADIQPMISPQTEPLEELLLELTDPCIKEKYGVRHAQATARLIYIPGEKGKHEVVSEGRFRFYAPLGPIEKEELSWYLERYYTWPAGVFKQRAQKVEKQLPKWGKALYDAVLNDDSVRDVLVAWESAKTKSARRFTVFVDSQLVKGSAKKKQAEAIEAGTLLLGLPWELLNDGRGYLFQGARPVQVRRRLPNRRSLEIMVSEPPIRILLVSPRPEDDRAGYIDHRSSALPLVTALENMGDMAELTVLSPPTFPALKKELLRAKKADTPYHVVHFDGHGVYNRDLDLGGLCFEDPKDQKKLEKRESQIKYANELAAVIRDHRIPLIFLEASQSAMAQEDPTASVAGALLDEGVASVVAMSYFVLEEAARKFVQGFYMELAVGSRVGEAMLAGQRKLKSDTFRLKIFGAGRLELEDWFVPVLYQGKEDMQLLKHVPSGQIKAIDRQSLENRFGALPATPPHNFIGRSQDLLKLERLLAQKSFAVLCGQGGEGKTTLAAELARWMIRTRRFDRAVFVSVENVYDVRTVVDQIGQQLVPNFSVSVYPPEDLLTKALLPIERELRNQHTLVIVDSMESILPTYGEVPRFEPDVLETFFDICAKLQSVADTRLLFTSREALPEPFDTKSHQITLSRLNKKDAIELVHQAMTAAGLVPKEDNSAAQPEVEALVQAVNCHAHSLVLLAPYISEFGVRHTTENLGLLMSNLHKKYPDERERSLFASVELSLRRLSPEIREKIKPLGVFQGGGNIYTLTTVLELTDEEREVLVRELQEIGLAELMPYGFLRFHPGLCPYLLSGLERTALVDSTARWVGIMRQIIDFLYDQISKDAQLALNLTTLELPNLVHLLEHVRAQGDAEATVNLATKLEQLISYLGRPHLLARIEAIREEEAKNLANWSHTWFDSYRMKIERILDRGNFPQALQEAQALLKKCVQAGEEAYEEAAYDTAMAIILLGRVLKQGGAADIALTLLAEAHTHFQKLAHQGNTSAARMASASLTEKGECLRDLGRLQEAAAAYEEGIEISETLKNERQAAIGKIQLGTVRMDQKRFDEALNAYEEARKIFENLGEPALVAVIWHQIGRVHEETDRFEVAEQAYRQALAIRVQQNMPADEAVSLNQLGNLYNKMGRLEEAMIFYMQAADKYVEINDMAKEGRTRSNIADTLIKLKRYQEARQQIHRAMECKRPYGHAAEPWKTWNILCDLEQAEGREEGAARARDQAIQLYLAYRRDGGENHEPGGRLCHAFRQARQENKAEEMADMLTELANQPDIDPSLKPLIPKLQALLSGSREPGLAADLDLHYYDAAEILLLLEDLS